MVQVAQVVQVAQAAPAVMPGTAAQEVQPPEVRPDTGAWVTPMAVADEVAMAASPDWAATGGPVVRVGPEEMATPLVRRVEQAAVELSTRGSSPASLFPSRHSLAMKSDLSEVRARLVREAQLESEQTEGRGGRDSRVQRVGPEPAESGLLPGPRWTVAGTATQERADGGLLGRALSWVKQGAGSSPLHLALAGLSLRTVFESVPALSLEVTAPVLWLRCSRKASTTSRVQAAVSMNEPIEATSISIRSPFSPIPTTSGLVPSRSQGSTPNSLMPSHSPIVPCQWISVECLDRKELVANPGPLKLHPLLPHHRIRQ